VKEVIMSVVLLSKPLELKAIIIQHFVEQQTPFN